MFELRFFYTFTFFLSKESMQIWNILFIRHQFLFLDIFRNSSGYISNTLSVLKMASRGTDYLKKNDSAYKKREILAAYNSNGDWRSLYVEPGVKKSTAYRWIEEGNKLDVRRGRRFVKVTEQQ